MFFLHDTYIVFTYVQYKLKLLRLSVPANLDTDIMKVSIQTHNT